MCDFNTDGLPSANAFRWEGSDWSHISGCDGCVEKVDNTAINVRVTLYYRCVDPTWGDGACGDQVVFYSANLRFGCTGGGIPC